MNNQNRAAKRTSESGEHKSLRCFISARAIPIETYKMADDGRKWKALAIQRKQLHRELASWADADGKHACPSLASLIRATGYSRVTVWRRIQELESLGLLVSTGKSGYQGTAEYTVVIPGASIVSDSQSASQPIVSDSTPIVSDSTPKVSDSPPIVSPRGNPTVLPFAEKPLAADGAAGADSSAGNADPRFPLVKESYISQYEKQSAGAKADFDGSDGKALKALLEKHPELSAVRLIKILNNAFASECGPLGKHFRLRAWCGFYGRYMDGPLKLNRFDQPQPEKWEQPRLGYAKRQKMEEERQLAEMEAAGLRL